MPDNREIIVEDDVMTLARLPELVQWIEKTAYALIRDGDTKTGNALFVAVAAAQNAVEAKKALQQSNSDASRAPIVPAPAAKE
ncbi:hypothetical protein [Cognatiyoonia sp. IB215182]|uniref:hypothetical protein n=1 Tax=Cognatiyoonia sp. IB215182 TaxID=3097353 RepID=UPI002A0F7D25|nr:hypothetical protein [Cognatiyoonia sp. IB215182]MDX8355194.1 hypothetical protein [Cognatiyoonia sp. IB215182]